MVSWKKPLNQPAKQADRILAPGDGEAEPGVTTPISKSLRSWRQMVVEVVQPVCTFICRPLRGLGRMLVQFPQGLVLFPPAAQAS